jgi:hypothetical protein
MPSSDNETTKRVDDLFRSNEPPRRNRFEAAVEMFVPPPAVEAFKRHSVEKGRSFRDVIKDILYKAATEFMVADIRPKAPLADEKAEEVLKTTAGSLPDAVFPHREARCEDVIRRLISEGLMVLDDYGVTVKDGNGRAIASLAVTASERDAIERAVVR